MWVGPRQSKNAPYRKGENMDGMEAQENEAGRGGGGGGRVKGQRGRKERGGGGGMVGGTHRLHRCIRACIYAKGNTMMVAMVVKRGHTPPHWSFAISRWLLRACECGGWCWRYRRGVQQRRRWRCSWWTGTVSLWRAYIAGRYIVVVSERLAAGILGAPSNVDSSHIRTGASCRFLPVSDVIRCILRIRRLPMWSDRVNMIPR